MSDTENRFGTPMPSVTEVVPGVSVTGQSNASVGTRELQNRFGFHKATIEGPNATAPTHSELREAFLEFAEYLDSILPNSRGKSLAFTELESASMWAHKAISEQAPLISEGE